MMSWRSQEKNCRQWTAISVGSVILFFLLLVWTGRTSSSSKRSSSTVVEETLNQRDQERRNVDEAEEARPRRALQPSPSPPWPTGSLLGKAYTFAAANIGAEQVATTRILFVGDSITRGMAQKNQRHRKAFITKRSNRPVDGLCSYRYSLYLELLQQGQSKVPKIEGGAQQQQVVRFVGPETQPHGGPYPERCVKESEFFGRNAAHWGISIDQVLDNSYTIPKNSRSNHGKWTEEAEEKETSPPTDRPQQQQQGGGGGGAQSKLLHGAPFQGLQAAPLAQHAVMRGERLYQWVRRSRPNLVFVAIGTNDLAGAGSNVTEEAAARSLLHQHIVPTVRQILRAGTDVVKAQRAEGNKRLKIAAAAGILASACPLMVVLAPLLPRNDSATIQDRVLHYNSLLAQQKKLSGELCGFRNNNGAGAVQRHDLEHPEFNPLFCSSCIAVLDRLPSSAGLDLGPSSKNGTSECLMYYDGLHPNAKGEVALGKAYATQLLEPGG